MGEDDMAWQDIERQAAQEGISARVVAMEAIQRQLLDALYADPRALPIAFQGGTCLRLVHGGHSYSEDLDLVSTEIADEVADELMASAARRAGPRLALTLGPCDARLDAPKVGAEGRLRAWWFRAQRHGTRDVLRVKIELGRYPAHEASAANLRPSESVLTPAPLVKACSPRELLADKVNALAQRAYVKGRDLYDVWFLRGALGIALDPALVAAKFVDYRTERPRDALRERLEGLNGEQVRAEMARFLPRATRALLEAEDYAPVLAATRWTIEEVLA
jgi:predicted nucleotidyltransferase component of viral defense system